MRRLGRLTALGMLCTVWVLPAGADFGLQKKDQVCGEFGTAVHFENSPSAAATKALKEKKLVIVLHVSGNFEDPDFT